MRYILSHMSCACATGRSNSEVLANTKQGSLAGMIPISGDIPGREIYFGMVPGDLPEISEPEFDIRTNRLLLHAVNNFRAELDEFLKSYPAERIAIVLGASNTGIDEAQRNVDKWLDSGKKPKEMKFSQIELGTPADYLKKLLGVKGPAYTVSTACSSATKAFATARRLIENNVADAAIIGGVDGRCRFAMNGFHALGALSQGRCRPLAEDRDGINLGEGVALFTLEKTGTVPVSEKTGTVPVSEKTGTVPVQNSTAVYLAGCGESSDSYHATAPDPEGRGAEAAMRAALEDAGTVPAQIAYLNLHGTGTQANDAMECKAARRVFGEGVRMESTKSLTGHCLGAAGAVEAAICWLYINSGHVKGAAMSNSFAFGGSNASVIFSPGESNG